MTINESTFYVLIAAVGLSAIALVVQAVCLVAVVRMVQSSRRQLELLTPRVESLLESADRTLQDTRKQVKDVISKAGAVLDTTQAQVVRTDKFLTEATERVRAQLDRVEIVLDDSISRVHQTVMVLNNGVLRPLREVIGVIAGVRGAVQFFLHGKRPNVSQATTDEEMFI